MCVCCTYPSEAGDDIVMSLMRYETKTWADERTMNERRGREKGESAETEPEPEPEPETAVEKQEEIEVLRT
jgi:hypothetical protein